MDRNIVPDNGQVEELTAEEMERVAGSLYITRYAISLWRKVRADNMYTPSLGGDFDDGRE